MKRKILLTAFTVLTAATLFAQRDFYGRPFRLGFKVDPVFVNNLSPKENGMEKSGSGFGINYGLMADVMFSDGRGAFATGVEVAHASSKLEYIDNDGLYGKGDYKINLQYLQIPLSVKLKTNPMETGTRFWGQFGTYLGALLGSRADYTPGSGSTSAAVSNAKIMNATNKVNMGLLLGAGIQHPVAERTDLYLGLGFENGFTDITSNNDWNDGKVNLNRWALRLGVFF